MKRLLALLLVLGGVLVMVTGCTVFADKQSDEAQVKQDMKPFFDFLAEENKDFSKVKRYVSSVIVYDNTGRKAYDVIYENGQTIYQIKDAEENVIQETNVSIVNNQLVYEDANIEPFPNDWFFVTIPRSAIDKSEVIRVKSSHPETYMRALTLKMTENVAVLQKLKEQWGIATEEPVIVSLRADSSKKFDVDVSLPLPQRKPESARSANYYISLTFE